AFPLRRPAGGRRRRSCRARSGPPPARYSSPAAAHCPATPPPPAAPAPAPSAAAPACGAPPQTSARNAPPPAQCPPAPPAPAPPPPTPPPTRTAIPPTNPPSPPAPRKSLFDAVISRMSVRVGLLPPTFTNSRVWITRSSFACSGKLSSLISSMNSVPVCANAKNPVRCSTAPVKLPRTCPKRWLSISPSGIAVQSSVTSGRSHRALCAWIARAISSLPVPDSPDTHTFASPDATFSIFASTSASCADCPTSPCAPTPLRPRPPHPPPHPRPPRLRALPPPPPPPPRQPQRRRIAAPLGPQHHHRAVQPQPPQPLPHLPRRQRRPQVHHHQPRPAVRPHRKLELVERANEVRLPAAKGGQAADESRQLQRFVEHQEIHGASSSPRSRPGFRYCG